MLTHDLMKINSLNPNVDRLAFSIFLKMNFKGEILGESRIEKNIINSRFKLSY
jgi:exoribonuclease R